MKLTYQVLFLKVIFTSLLFSACSNIEYTTIATEFIDKEIFSVQTKTYPVYSFQERLEKVQTNQETLNIQGRSHVSQAHFGKMNNSNFGKTEAILFEQFSLSSVAPTFGEYTQEIETTGIEDTPAAIAEDEKIISVYLEIPFLFNVRDADGDGVIDKLDIDPNDSQSDTDGDTLTDLAETQGGTNPLSNDSDGDGILDAEDTDNSSYLGGDTQYDVDYVYGKGTAPFNIKIQELTYYLNTLDIASNFESNVVYYSDRNFIEEGFVGETLYDGEYMLNFEEVKINFKEDDPLTTDVDETTTIETRKSPRLRVALNTDFFQKKLLDKEGSDELKSLDAFTNFFRGLAIQMGNSTEDLYMMLNTAGATINITYEYNKYNDNGTPDDRTDFSIDKKQSTFVLRSGIQANYLKNTNENPNIELSSEIETKNIYVKGGAGYRGKIRLFDKTATNSGVLSEIKKQAWLVKEANLVFYVDPTTVLEANATTVTADRVYLYKRRDGIPLLDYFSDVTLASTDNKYAKTIFGGILEEKNGKPYRYKINITNHINDIIRRDSTNIDLSLGVISDIGLERTLKGVLQSEPSSTINYPVGSLLSPLGVALIGSNPTEEQKDKKVQLEILYTDLAVK